MTESYLPRAPRVPVSIALLRLYRGDVIFRSSTDFAVIGLIVYMFVVPISFDWLSLPAARPAASAPSSVTAPAVPAGIAQAANPGASRKVEGKIERQWFSMSDPTIMPALNRAADQLENSEARAALATLAAIGRPDDPNVLHLSGSAYPLTRDKDGQKQAYDAQLRAAEAGHPEAMNTVGQILRLGAVGAVDMEAAVRWYERGAAAGSGAAATNAGRAYIKGWARSVDHAKALKYYRQGAERGDAWGMHNYGALLLDGNSIERDATAARGWIEKAAATGLAYAQHSSAKLARQGLGGARDLDAFVQWAQAAAAQEYAPALHDLGLFYLEPDDGRAADPARAAGYLRRAALKRHAPSQFAYATLCERGVGIPTSAVQAFIYYSLALRGGEVAAQGRLEALRARMSTAEIENAQKLVAASS